MSALAYLHNHGLSAEPLPDGKLSISPVMNITPEIRNWIRAHKADVLAELAREADEDAREYFEERAAIMEHDGGLSRTEAERLASARVYEYRLSGISQWLTLLMPIDSDMDAAKHWLDERYGAERVLDVRRYRPRGGA